MTVLVELASIFYENFMQIVKSVFRKKKVKQDQPGLNLDPEFLPKHIVIIPDGNRRWAKQRHLPSIEGHRRGLELAKSLATTCKNWGIKTVSIWAFSTENWGRAKDEVEYLMKAFNKYLNDNVSQFVDDGARIRVLGRKDRIPQYLLKTIKDVETRTEKGKEYQLNICLDYGGRDEIIRAVNTLVKKGKKITEEVFSDSLDTAGMPDPDLIIRTSGEMRTSGMMPWQAAYAEYYFSPVYFPDFSVDKLREAVVEFASRQRRFGK